MILDILSRPWPWWLVGALLGATAPLLLLVGNKQLGVSGNLRTICAAVLPRRIEYFTYDWHQGRWNLLFGGGILVGGFVGGVLLAPHGPSPITPAARATMAALGLHDTTGWLPREVFSVRALLTVRGIVMMAVGGFLVGFGAAYGGGCTSGHGISGVADLQAASFIAVVSLFVAGALTSWFLLPLVL
jgi:uncharacterized membrane protein YedE/YeeE